MAAWRSFRDGEPGACRGPLAVVRGGWEIGTGPLLRLVAPRDGRTDSVERCIFWLTIGSLGRVFAAPSGSAAGSLATLMLDHRCARSGYRLFRRYRRSRTDRHQVRPLVRFADASGSDRCGDRSWPAVDRTGAPHRTCLF